MNDLDSNSLADQVTALQRQVFLLMLALIVVTGTLVAYLSYESHHIGKEVANIQTQIVQPYDKKLPAIKTFITGLATYGNAHPEFRPVLLKYGIGTNAVPPKK